MMGDDKQALEVLARLERMEKEPFMPAFKRAVVLLKPSLKFLRPFKKKYVSPMLKGIVYYGLNRQEEAIREFEKSLEAGGFFLAGLFSTGLADLPWKQEFFSRPECREIRKKLGLP